MIQANELRIGNWMMGNVPFQIEPNDIGLDYYHEQQKGVSRWEPIPLTEEWLIKFGFKRLFDKFWMKKHLLLNNGFVPMFTDGNYHEEEIGEQLKYVHQLQNLYFALTGEELTHQKQ